MKRSTIQTLSTKKNQKIIEDGTDGSNPAEGINESEESQGSQDPINTNVEDEMVPDGKGGLKSWVWNHFTTYTVQEKKKVNGEWVMVERRRAKCNYCPKSRGRRKLGDYAADSHSTGTSAMNQHLKIRCKYFKRIVLGQATIGGDGTASNNLTIRGFDQDVVNQACIKMIVIDEMPFSTVEKSGFRNFCEVACPLFKIPSRRMLVTNFFKMYESEKIDLRKELGKHRISLTTDTWTSVQNMNYMVLTAHFIDNEWTMQKRIISFCQIGNHQGVTIGKLIESCLIEWKIDKVMSITMDNASANKTAMEWLRARMNRWSESKAILGGRLLHVRCTAHIINLIVRDGLKKLNRSIIAIRNAVAYVRSSPQRLATFKSAAILEKLESKSLVVLDVRTRWNSTKEMLRSALVAKKAFERLKEDDYAYIDYFHEPDRNAESGSDVEDAEIIRPSRIRGKVGPPNDDDWEKCEVFMNFLQVFHDVTLNVSSSTKPNVHTTFHDILTIGRSLNAFKLPEVMNNGEAMGVVLDDMSQKMKKKFTKYFGRYMDVNPLIFLGLILDPRFKLLFLERILILEGYKKEEVKQKCDEIKNLLIELYDVYKPQPKIVSVDGASSIMFSDASESQGENMSGASRSEIITDWEKYVAQTQGVEEKHEVEIYLTDKIWSTKNEFNILTWWKVHGATYPVISMIAKDVLATQVSTVASESAFSTGGRVIDYSRSSMTPRTVEALICLQNWLKNDLIVCAPPKEDQPSIENFEWYEKTESEVDNEGSSCSTVTEPLSKKAKMNEGTITNDG